MALIYCPECGKQVSDRAPACPVCGCPIAAVITPQIVDRTQDIEKYLQLASNGIQARNVEQVEKYCQAVLEIDPQNSAAWELQARGLHFNDTLRDNRIAQEIASAANAINFRENDKESLAVSLYDSIYSNITGLFRIVVNQMPMTHAPSYMAQCMNYYGDLLVGIPNLPIAKIQYELSEFDKLYQESKRAFFHKKRYVYASCMGRPSWADQYRMRLREKGINV